MSDSEINISIAEAIGLKLFVLHKPIHDPFGYYRHNANGYTDDIESAWRVTAEVAAKYINGKKDQPDRVIAEHAPTPNYCTDLNAMHEAEKTLKGSSMATETAYWSRLTRQCFIGSATAHQRAEAFLRTIGKWKEPTP